MGNIQNFYHNTSFSADKDGKIGIGNIESPVDLYVGSVLTGTFGDGTFTTDAIVTNDTKSITIGANKRAAWGMNATTPTSTTFQSKLNIWTGNGDHITFGGSSTGIVTAWEEFNVWINNDSTNPGTLHLYHLNSKSEFARFTGGSGDNWLGINGDVGIGTTSPTNKLHVFKNASLGSPTAPTVANAGLRIQDNANSMYFDGNAIISVGAGNLEIGAATTAMLLITNGAERMRITNTGNIGIATDSPVAALDITKITPSVTTFFPYLQLSQRGTVSNTKTGISFRNTEYNWDMGHIATERQGSSNSFDLVFYTANAGADGEGLRIDHLGNVGINNTSPDHKLDVTGDIYANGQMLTKGAAMACFTVLGDLTTGLGNFNAAGQVSLVTDGKPEITVDKGTIVFDNYTATAVATTGSLTVNQGQQAPTENTLANICVDPDGNVVRGSQELTWTFTKAQLDALATTTSGGTQLIQAPGANKAVIVEESNWMVKYSGTGSMSQNGFEIRQATVVLADAGISRIPSGQINNIMSSAQGTPTNPSYGFYSRDLPQYNNDGRTYKTNAQTVLMRINTNPTPANLVSISIKLKCRLFNATTF
tara:strand:- start:1059 stop:2837 length:1779 start_codon:yes stop_codon:yes gene_type:complete